jgi:hypothetical protein
LEPTHFFVTLNTTKLADDMSPKPTFFASLTSVASQRIRSYLTAEMKKNPHLAALGFDQVHDKPSPSGLG